MSPAVLVRWGPARRLWPAVGRFLSTILAGALTTALFAAGLALAGDHRPAPTARLESRL